MIPSGVLNLNSGVPGSPSLTSYPQVVQRSAVGGAVSRTFAGTGHSMADGFAAALGTLALNMMFPTVTSGGTVKLPLVGNISGVTAQAVAAGVTTASSDWIQNTIGMMPNDYRVGGLVSASDYVATGLAPVLLNELAHGQWAGFSATAVDSAKVFAGAKAGVLVKHAIMG